MTPKELAAWRDRFGFNDSEAAAALGIHRNSIRKYLAGEAEIPLTVALAAAARAHGIPPIGGEKGGKK